MTKRGRPPTGCPKFIDGVWVARIIMPSRGRRPVPMPGIPEADRDRMFVPFQRLGDTDNTTGVGLGLALARGLTEAMDGTLTAEDTPGGGLTMTISLPAAPGN